MPTAERLSSTRLYPAGRNRPQGSVARPSARRIQRSSFSPLTRREYDGAPAGSEIALLGCAEQSLWPSFRSPPVFFLFSPITQYVPRFDPPTSSLMLICVNMPLPSGRRTSRFATLGLDTRFRSCLDSVEQAQSDTPTQIMTTDGLHLGGLTHCWVDVDLRHIPAEMSRFAYWISYETIARKRCTPRLLR